LDRLRPAVHITQLVVLAVEGKRFVFGPSSNDEFMGLVVFVASQRRDLAIGEVRVHRCAYREAGDQTSSRDAVEHRELFSHANRWVVESDGITDHTNSSIACAPSERCGDQIG